jgi:hypothetical protein
MRKSSSTERVPSGLHSPAVGSLGPLEVFFHRREELHSTILAPLVALVLWSFVMWALCNAYSGGNERQNNIRPPPSRPGVSPPATRPGALEGGQLQQPHGATDPFLRCNAYIGLAWLYASLRVAHSLIQAIINVVMLRFIIFIAASLVLLVMSVRAALIVY